MSLYVKLTFTTIVWCLFNLPCSQNSILNKEMDRIQEYCQNVAQQTNAESLGKELILMRDSFLNPRPSKSETGT